MTTYFSLVNHQFSFAALALRERFKVLNDKFLSYSPIILGDEPSIKFRPYILDTLMQMHDLLCDGIQSLNSTFTWQVNYLKYFLLENCFLIKTFTNV